MCGRYDEGEPQNYRPRPNSSLERCHRCLFDQRTAPMVLRKLERLAVCSWMLLSIWKGQLEFQPHSSANAMDWHRASGVVRRKTAQAEAICASIRARVRRN